MAAQYIKSIAGAPISLLPESVTTRDTGPRQSDPHVTFLSIGDKLQLLTSLVFSRAFMRASVCCFVVCATLSIADTASALLLITFSVRSAICFSNAE